MYPLRDVIDIVTDTDGANVVATLPAYVGYTRGDIVDDSGRRYVNREDLVAIVESAANFDPALHYVKHKSTVYEPNGSAAPHYQHGVLHHVTIPLRGRI